MRPEHGIARVRRVTDRAPVGFAFAVGARHMVTCAHVVNMALGRPLRDAGRPDQAELHLVFPFGGSNRGHQPLRTAEVAMWLPDDPDRFDLEDVALLELHDSLPSGVPRLRPATTIGHSDPVQILGPGRGRPPIVYVSGEVMGAVDRSRFHVNEKIRGVFRVERGFSGGPVWYPGNGRVVGMLQAASVDDEATDVYIIGRDTIAEVYPEFTARETTDVVGIGATVLFGAIGTLAAVTKVGWSWIAAVTGLAVAAVVYVVGRLVR